MCELGSIPRLAFPWNGSFDDGKNGTIRSRSVCETVRAGRMKNEQKENYDEKFKILLGKFFSGRVFFLIFCSDFVCATVCLGKMKNEGKENYNAKV